MNHADIAHQLRTRRNAAILPPTQAVQAAKTAQMFRPDLFKPAPVNFQAIKDFAKTEQARRLMTAKQAAAVASLLDGKLEAANKDEKKKDKKSNTGMYVGIGFALVLLGFAGYHAFK